MRQEISEALEETRLGNRQMLESAMGTTEVILRIQERLIRNQLSLAGTMVATGIKQFRAVLDSDSPGQLMALEMEAAAEFTEKVVATMQENLEIFLQAKDEYAYCCEDGIAGIKSGARGAEAIATAGVVPASTRSTGL